MNTGKSGNIGGRLDILVGHRDRNLAVIELKHVGQELTDADRDQGISYARLLPEIAPIVIVTNGIETRIYNTYTKQLWQPETLDELKIEFLFQSSAKLAASDQDDAVRMLIAGNADIWSQVIESQTKPWRFSSDRTLYSKRWRPKDHSYAEHRRLLQRRKLQAGPGSLPSPWQFSPDRREFWAAAAEAPFVRADRHPLAAMPLSCRWRRFCQRVALFGHNGIK